MEQEETSRIAHRFTNENLESIVLGLQPNKHDTILAVGGSGDQAFALLEHAKKVCCVDNEAIQIEYIAERADQLKNRNYKKFIAPHCSIYHERDEYLKNRERIKKIRGNLKNLKLRCADIFKVAKEEGFTKIYLSNVIGFDRAFRAARSRAAKFKEKVECAAERLPKDGLIYVSDHEYLCKEIKSPDILGEPIITEYGTIKISNPQKLFPPGLMIDPELTTIARRYADNTLWQPAVYRRVR